MLDLKKTKTFALVLSGNILEYYDFLLFVHLGSFLLPMFLPPLDETQSHLFTLFLLSVVFILRPLGGYLFGCIADLKNRRTALSQSIFWTGIATLGLACLPLYDTLGILSSFLLIFFRIIQGISMGGEYPIAGTYLMETYPHQRGLLSGILSASTSLGSLFALGFAWWCLQDNAPDEIWRLAFFLGGIASIISYFLRKNLKPLAPQHSSTKKLPIYPPYVAIISTLLLGVLCSTLTWLPVTYSNFYLTKILHVSAELSIAATFMAILPVFFLKPFFGKLSDYFNYFSYLSFSSFLAIPLIFTGFYMLMQVNILGQILLVTAASCFVGPVHAIMNSFFKKEYRSRKVNVFFMLGVSLGGLAPSLFGFVVEKTNFHFFPAIMTASIALIAGIIFSYFAILFSWKNNHLIAQL